MNRFLCFVCLVVVVSFPSTAARHVQSKRPAISFATVDEGRRILTTRDDFVVRLSPFDRAARVGTDQETSEQEYLRFLSSNVLEWTAQDKAIVKAAWSALEPKLHEMALPFPPTIYMIKTTGQEEGGAEYTRSNAIDITLSFAISCTKLSGSSHAAKFRFRGNWCRGKSPIQTRLRTITALACKETAARSGLFPSFSR
jgi:hypothetical protein